VSAKRLFIDDPKVPDLSDSLFERVAVQGFQAQADKDFDSFSGSPQIRRKNLRFASSVPAKLTGSATPQCALIG